MSKTKLNFSYMCSIEVTKGEVVFKKLFGWVIHLLYSEG